MTATKPVTSEMHPGPGFRIRINYPSSCDRKLIERYREFESPDISDICNRMYSMSSNIRNIVNTSKIVGKACTVKVFPGDNLMVHKALDIAEPGDIIVVDACGSNTTAVIGDMISTKAKHRGIEGFVIDGLVRDIPGLKNVGLPVYAKGGTPVGPLHRGPGEINFPVCCGGIVVNPGDIICADITGVVVVRQDFADDVLKRLDQQQEDSIMYVEAVRKGMFSNEWVDQLLEERSCRIISD